MADAAWTLMESDPAIFTSLLDSLGVHGAQVEEVYSLERNQLQHLLTPIYGFIFLFKYVGRQAGQLQGTLQTPSSDHYFANQVVTNACATLALLNLTLNIQSPSISIGPELSQLKEFSQAVGPMEAGHTIAGSEHVRQVHNSFARPDPFPMEEARPATEDDDVYHFVAYLPIGDELYELDGLKESPVSHGKWNTRPGASWTEKAQEVVQNRIATYQAGELMFNLMAVCGDRLEYLQSRIEALSQPDATPSPGEPSLDTLVMNLEDEMDKRRQWDVDNHIRRHNHVGLAHALLSLLAKKGKLDEAKKAAEEKHKQRKETQKNLASRGIKKDLMQDD